MEKMNVKDIVKELNKINNSWELNDGNIIQKEFHFENFVQAFSFMTSVAIIAEKLDHHPDWENSYNRVKISLTNHELGGLSKKDFKMAEEIDNIKEYFTSSNETIAS